MQAKIENKEEISHEKKSINIEDEVECEQPYKSIFSRLGLNIPFLEYKTPFDKTKFSCIENILRGSIKSFGIGYGVKSALGLVKTLIGFKKLMKDPKLLLNPLLDKASFKTGFFALILSFFLKGGISLLRVLRKKDDGINAFIGGALAGYFSMFMVSSKKTFVACFFLSRAVECFYNSLANKGLIKRKKYHWVLIYGLGMMLIGYSFANERYLMDPGSLKSFDFVT